MPENWTVSVAGRSYGPYSIAQMQAFAAEGRLAPHSLVARAGEPELHAASEDPELRLLFEPAKPEAALHRPTPAPSFGRQDKEETNELSHIIIVTDVKSSSIAGIEEEIFNLGHAYAITPQVWILTTEQSVNAVRNVLIQKLGKLDSLFAVDATHNKAAWFNFGPESEARIRRVWQKAAELPKRAAV